MHAQYIVCSNLYTLQDIYSHCDWEMDKGECLKEVKRGGINSMAASVYGCSEEECNARL